MGANKKSNQHIHNVDLNKMKWRFWFADLFSYLQVKKTIW